MVRAGKQELQEIRRRLEEIEKEVSAVKAELSQYFTSEEQKILAYEASVGKNSMITDVNVLDGKKEEKEGWTEKQEKNKNTKNIKNKEIQDGSSMGQRPFLM